MTRMKLTVHEPGHVTLEYTDPVIGERVSREFCVHRYSDAPSYVWEVHADGRRTQPCERLCGCGNTLKATAETLPDVIRREYRRMVRAAKKVA